MNSLDSSAMRPPVGTPMSTAEWVTDLFHDEIASGRWRVGERIPTETELMAWVGAGRNTVREAIQSLVQAGLVSKQQGRGTFVIAGSELVRSVTRRASRARRRDGLELRAAIDGAASALAARRRTDADIEQLRALLAARTEAWASGRADDRIDADIALHRAIITATHNELFADLYDGLAPLFERVLVDDVTHDEDPHAEQHIRLIEAIIAQDATGAEAVVSELLAPLVAAASDPE
ncbi:FadR/GntR family transcriptional regulator [Microbacterium sp. SLBN-146]|uniref:FadR/GntR family transcriptional regulator n=1 Tax=Microbacterium sp. SLBN-146 TaxID=2768457 RepID=UPI001154E2EE|nr:FCD domain-containing protein [Microbacterium sp. SLBN-146]TQJ29626.1 GntR family transcriptional regulator [Microbacterium sp. SLBN-146]